MPEKFDETPFLKPGGVYCDHCVGKRGDHAPGCIVLAKIQEVPGESHGDDKP